MSASQGGEGGDSVNSPPGGDGSRGPGGDGSRGPGGLPADTDQNVAAATVVPLRDGPEGFEVLMLRRSSGGSFAGMWVFPGGMVDAADQPGSDDGGDERGDEIAAARAAAVREAREEADIDLDAESLVLLSFWLAPVQAPRRYATWFFLAPVHGQPQIVVDQYEIHEHRWLTPTRALQLQEEGQITLAPPTFTTLSWLTAQPDVAAALRSAGAATTLERFETRIATSDGVAISVWAGDAGYEDGDMDRPGPRRRLVMDPGGWRLEFRA